jgi:hypothetical protein
VKYAAQANASSLISILGLSNTLASKISNLDNYGVQFAQIGMSAVNPSSEVIMVYTVDGFVPFVTAGVYEDSGALKIVAEKIDSTVSVIP